MKKIAVVALAMLCTAAWAQTHVRGYVKKDGTYVAPHYRSAPDSTRVNNYSAQGNANPYTGRAGTASPYAAPAPVYTAPAPAVSSGCYTGPRGGTYTITASGRKNYGGC